MAEGLGDEERGEGDGGMPGAVVGKGALRVVFHEVREVRKEVVFGAVGMEVWEGMMAGQQKGA